MEQKRNTAGTSRVLDALLDGLNPAQRSAATYGIDAEEGPPPLLIAAGAGTGKTKTLAHRVARLILHDSADALESDPSGCLAKSERVFCDTSRRLSPYGSFSSGEPSAPGITAQICS